MNWELGRYNFATFDTLQSKVTTGGTVLVSGHITYVSLCSPGSDSVTLETEGRVTED